MINTQKTNWKYIVIFLVFALLIGGGVLWWIKSQEPSFTPLPEITKPENWKTYRNEEYGFEIKFPEDWAITTKRETGYFSHITLRIEFQSPQDKDLLVYINVRENPELTMEEYFKKLKAKIDQELEIGLQEEYLFPFVGYEPKETSVHNGQTFYKFIMPGVIAEQSTLFSYGNYIFDISTYLSKSMQDNLYIYNQMLSTFKFLK